jgi:cysteinyl-tRNA synthetase
MIRFHNTLTRAVEEFKPLNPGKVGIYLCGPTVYDRAHIGNARSAVVFDMLYRFLRLFFQVTYVRNITDIDDKIINAANESGQTIADITSRATRLYHEDMATLGVLPPTIEPKATEHIQEMIDLIDCLIQKGNAYVAQEHVLFDSTSDPTYGCLSHHPLEEIIAGSRVELAPYKRNPSDFVLWKPSTPKQPGWESPWFRGRPGWHIECSAMSLKHLGESFDIHGGGQDLIFPHHENEVAQSTCCVGKGKFAQVWLHHGMLIVRGTKMSKSLGNFITVPDLLQQANGETIRFAILSTHYRQPLDWQDDTLHQAKSSLDRLYTALKGYSATKSQDAIDSQVISALEDDLNTPKAIARLHELVHMVNRSPEPREKEEWQTKLYQSGQLLGFFLSSCEAWFQGGIDPAEIEQLIEQRNQARLAKDFAKADRIRQQLLEQNIVLEDSPQGTTWRKT